MNVGQLLFVIVDQLAGANWQRTGKKTGRPQSLDRRLAAASKRADAQRAAEAATDDDDEFAAIATYLSQFDPAYTGDLIIAPGTENLEEVKPAND